jgi:hypothetical protein
MWDVDEHVFFFKLLAEHQNYIFKSAVDNQPSSLTITLTKPTNGPRMLLMRKNVFISI